MYNYSDPKWVKRARDLKKKRGKCQKCQSSENLEVHHPRYITGRESWEYSDNELEVLCKPCHLQEHDMTAKQCRYAGCNKPIQPHFEYCYAHKMQVADDKIQEAKILKEQLRSAQEQMKILKGQVSSKNSNETTNKNLSSQINQLNEDINSIRRVLAEIPTTIPANPTPAPSSNPSSSENKFNPLLLIVIFALLAGGIFWLSQQKKSNPVPSGTTNAHSTSATQYDCFKCGAKMVERKNSKTGKKFFGCSRFPKCKNTF